MGGKDAAQRADYGFRWCAVSENGIETLVPLLSSETDFGGPLGGQIDPGDPGTTFFRVQRTILCRFSLFPAIFKF